MWLRSFVLAAAFASTIVMGAEIDCLRSQEVVVLLHGMGRSALSMKRLEWTLGRHGYRVVNVSYPSTRFSVEKLTDDHLRPALEEIGKSPPGQIHFVTHSLGGILVRHYLGTHAMTNLGRVVMLGPPNQGSEVADALKRWSFYRLLVGPSGMQLGTGAGDLPRQLGPARFEVGVIAGDRSFNPLFSRLLPGPDDGKVSVASARLEGMKDFLVVHHSHTWLPWRKAVSRQVLAFLKQGQFDRAG
jgi:pimeloyl-ACP methyl ester carboxylesterase